MTVESDADRLEMLEDWETAIIDGSTIAGIFDREYAEALDIAGYGPAFLARTSDVSGVSRGDTATIGGQAYTVQGIEADGTGMTLLRLQESD